MKTIDWYFDFISPYAYLQSAKIEACAEGVQLRCKPILFAGLLKHWGQKGPAEMATKRIFTYQHIAWYARQHQLPLTWPASHPFNPLPLLRLCVAKGGDLATIHRLFRFVWGEGHLPTDPQAWQHLLAELSIQSEQLNDAKVKDQVRLNTEEALARGVFGVPSAIVSQAEQADSPIFWGFDATPMLEAWLSEDPYFKQPAWLAASQVADGVVRRA